MTETTEAATLDSSPATAGREPTALPATTQIDRVVRYYSEATQDYRAWSPGFHMHFGFWRWGINPLRREAMLEEMTRQTVDRLQLPAGPGTRLVDLGCGLGSSSQWVARTQPELAVDGVTLVPWQVQEARRRTATLGLAGRVRILQADYTATGFDAASYDGAMAIESACHDSGAAKEGFIREASRLLKPGARLVVADGFLKGSGALNPLLRRLVDQACKGWALESFAEIGAFEACLGRHGFDEIKVEEISLRIAPCAAHVPWVSAKFFAQALVVKGLRLSAPRWRHLLACIVSPAIGLARRRFGYFLITATKAGSRPT